MRQEYTLPIDTRNRIMRKAILKGDLQNIIELAMFLKLPKVLYALKHMRHEKLTGEQAAALDIIIFKGKSKLIGESK